MTNKEKDEKNYKKVVLFWTKVGALAALYAVLNGLKCDSPYKSNYVKDNAVEQGGAVDEMDHRLQRQGMARESHCYGNSCCGHCSCEPNNAGKKRTHSNHQNAQIINSPNATVTTISNSTIYYESNNTEAPKENPISKRYSPVSMSFPAPGVTVEYEGQKYDINEIPRDIPMLIGLDTYKVFTIIGHRHISTATINVRPGKNTLSWYNVSDSVKARQMDGSSSDTFAGPR